MSVRRVAISCALVAAVATGSARADNAGDALKLLDQGIAMFKANDLKAAKTVFSKVRELMPDKANPYRWLGLVEARLGECGPAVKDLELFLARIPAGDARTVEAVTVHDACRDQLADKNGVLVVESTPVGAEVRIDRDEGSAVGVTPIKGTDISVGSHVLFLRKPGYVSVQKVFTVGKLETVRLDVNLEAVKVTVAAPASAIVAAPIEPAPVPERQKKKSVWPVVAGVVAGVVVVGAGVGIGVGVVMSEGGGDVILPSVAGH